MRHKNDLVRTKTITNNNNLDSYYSIDLMTYETFVLKSEMPHFYNQEIYLYDYKWYDIRYIVDYPYYYLSKSIFNKKISNLNNKKSVISRIIIFLIESISSWIIIEYIKIIIF